MECGTIRKILMIGIIGILILQGLTAVSTEERDSRFITETANIVLIEPFITSYNDDFIDIVYDSATSYLLETGEPLLPKVTKVFTFPIGTSIESVEVEYKNMQQIKINGLVRPAPEPVVDGAIKLTSETPKKEVYSRDAMYPYEMFNYQTKVGLNNDEHVIFLSVQCYPVKYNPVENIVQYFDEIEINIQHYKKYDSLNLPDDYELMIITPPDFSSQLQPLVTHKNDMGMNTMLSTTSDIYSTYDGRDDAESIKLAILDAVETYGVKYVMLVGGHKGQTHKWYIPVRDGISDSEVYTTDLYYADLYKLDGEDLVFADWDSNGDDEFAQWQFSKRDILDGAPDVYVGRLACRDTKQVEVVVEKIINYEKVHADDSWFKKMLLIGGDTYADSSGGIPEAEIDTNLSGSHMTGFSLEKIWASTGVLTGPEIVEDEINEGAGFVHMAGHANPAILVTHPLQDDVNKITIMQMWNIFDPQNLNPNLNNIDKLPIIMIGGCHNSQYNVGLANVIDGILEYGLQKYFQSRIYWMEWVPKCFSWWLTSFEDGGAIATMGNTGLGMGIWDYGYLTGLDGWLFPKFFYHYGQMGVENVGTCMGLAITDYVNEFNINSDGSDRQMVQQWALLGDPSLLPGGYE